MIYTRETELGTWRIEEDFQRNWVVLKLKRGIDRWRAINIFYTAGGAAAAVGCGETGDPTWDKFPHHRTEFELAHWQQHGDAKKGESAA